MPVAPGVVLARPRVTLRVRSCTLALTPVAAATELLYARLTTSPVEPMKPVAPEICSCSAPIKRISLLAIPALVVTPMVVWLLVIVPLRVVAVTGAALTPITSEPLISTVPRKALATEANDSGPVAPAEAAGRATTIVSRSWL